MFLSTFNIRVDRKRKVCFLVCSNKENVIAASLHTPEGAALVE